MNKDIVFITSRFPYPLDKGDKLRAFNQIKSLSRTVRVHLISISESEISVNSFNELEKYCTSINSFPHTKINRIFNLFLTLFSNMPFSVGYFFSSSIRRKIESIIFEINPEVIHCHLIRTAPYIHNLLSFKRSIDYMDCFSVGMEKQLESNKNWLKSFFIKMEMKRLRKFEAKMFDLFDYHQIISETDRDGLKIINKLQVEIIPNGVDFNIFYPEVKEKKYDILFSGHMGYVPNIYAAKYLIQHILPELPKSITMLNAGIGVTSEIRSLQSNQVTIQEDFVHIREAFWVSKILVAPMLISIGLQNKIIQAMAMKIPVVCSVVANDSISAPNNCILLAKTPTEYAQHINRLLNDSAFYESICENAFRFVHENFDWELINNRFEVRLNSLR